ncbi:heparin lyase I family protein [Vibrio sp. MA40-2]|uniref:heparin lyase I family protein n=1 Tax=Vibrio sp. MA40-2 TaxID=3391828 RepID=UPI0039A50CB7
MRDLLWTLFSLVILTGCKSTSENFGRFERSLNNTVHGYNKVKDPLDPSNTGLVEYFEVRDGDCSSNSGWSDCANDRERSELSQKTNRQSNGDEYWYAWELYLPEDYPNVYPTKVALGQFHQVNGKPVFMFQNQSPPFNDTWNPAIKGGYHLDRQVNGETVTMWELLTEEELRGKWHRIELHVKWSKSSDGFFKVWVNGEQKVRFNGQTLFKDTAYFKYGVYRSFLTRYKGVKKTDVMPTQRAYYRYVKRGSTRESIQPGYVVTELKE